MRTGESGEEADVTGLMCVVKAGFGGTGGSPNEAAWRAERLTRHTDKKTRAG